jgi:hypothetical protein
MSFDPRTSAGRDGQAVAGCGAGTAFEALRERGGVVAGVEPGIKLLELGPAAAR